MYTHTHTDIRPTRHKCCTQTPRNERQININLYKVASPLLLPQKSAIRRCRTQTHCCTCAWKPAPATGQYIRHRHGRHPGTQLRGVALSSRICPVGDRTQCMQHILRRPRSVCAQLGARAPDLLQISDKIRSACGAGWLARWLEHRRFYARHAHVYCARARARARTVTIYINPRRDGRARRGRGTSAKRRRDFATLCTYKLYACPYKFVRVHAHVHGSGVIFITSRAHASP